MNDVIRILVVEDQIHDYELAKREILRSVEQCVFERVENRIDFLRALEQFQPELILCDYNLPSFDGLTALKLAQQHLSSAPVIIWTGSMSEDIAVECMKQGASNYVIKDRVKRLSPAVVQALKERESILERRQAEEKYRSIFENSEEGIFQSLPEGRYINVNPSMARIYGYASPQEMMESITEIASQIYVDVSDRQYFLDLMHANGFVRNFEMKNNRKDGSIIWTSTTARVVRDDNGDILYYEGFLRDITERKLTAERLEESEKRFRALIENAMDNISLLAPDGTLLWETENSNRMLGYGLNAFVNRNIFDLMHPEDMAWTKILFGRVASEPGSQQNGTFRLKHHDGTWRWINATATNMLDNHSVHAIVINYRDVTQQKGINENLRQSEERYRLLFENNPLPMWIFDTETLRFITVNDAAIDHYGYPREEFLSMTIKDIRPPEDVPRLIDNLADFVHRTDRIGRAGIWRHKKKDGTRITVEIISHSMEFEGKKSELILAVDITKRHEAETEIQQRNDDLALVNALNEVINRGHGMDAVVELMRQEVKRIFGGEGVAIYLLDEDGKSLRLQQYILHPEVARKVEKVIGRPIPEIELPIQKGGYFEKALLSKQGRVTNDPVVIQKWMEEFTETTFLPRMVRGSIRKLVPSIFKLLNIKSTMLIPLVWEEKIIGLLDISGPNLFSAEDLRRIENIAGQLTTAIRRNQMEAELKQERNLLRTLIDNIPDRIYAMDTEGRKTLSNTADWKASGGKTIEDVIGKTDFETYPRELAEPFWKVNKEVLETGKHLVNYEEPGLDAEGNPVSILTTKIPLRNEEGKIIGLVGVGRDITERKQVEAKINELLAFNETILRNSPVGFITYKVSGECIFANENAAVIVGTSVESLRSQNFHTIASWKKSGIYEMVQKAIETQTVRSGDFHHHTTFGKNVWMTMHCVTFLLNEEEHVLLSISDISERKQAETALMESMAQFRTLFEASPEAIMLIDPHDEWPIVDCNSAACKMNGYRREELIGKPIDILNTEPAIPESRLSYLEEIKKTEVLRYETIHIHKDGTPIEIEVSTTLIQLAGRDMVLGIDRDITERKRAETAEREQRALAEALRDTSQILSGSLEHGEVLDHILASVERVVPHNAGTIMLIDDGVAHIVRSHGYDVEGLKNEVLGIKLSISETVNLRQILATGQTVIIPDTHEYEGWQRFPVTEWLRSSVGAPITIYGEIIGFICLDSDTPHFFTPTHAERLEAFADQAAVAIHNAHLLQKAQDEITERKQAEQALRQSENKAKALINALPDLMFRIDRDGTFLDYKAEKSDLYAQEELTLINKYIGDVSPAEFANLVNWHTQKCLESGEMQVFEYQLPILGRGIHEYEARMVVSGKDEVTAIVRDITERKQTEQELKLSHSLLNATLESTADGILVIASDGKITSFNQKFLELWRIPQELAEQKSDHVLLEFVMDQLKDPYEFISKVEELYHSPEGISWNELEFLDGRVFERFSQPLRLGGAIVGRVWSFHDITQRKQAEHALQQSQDRYHDLFDKSPISLWEEDYSLVKERVNAMVKSGITNFNEYLYDHPEMVVELASLVRIIDVNQATLELFHTQQKSDLLKDLPQLVDKDVLMHFREELLGLMSPSRRFIWEGPDKTFDNMHLDLIVTGTIPSGHEEDWSRVLVSIIDITERKRAEEELNEKQRQLTTLVSNLPGASYRCHNNNKYTMEFISAGILQLTGYPAEEFESHRLHYSSLMHPDDREQAWNSVQIALQEDRPFEIIYRIITANGSEKFVWEKGQVIQRAGEPVQIIEGLITDITELKRAEQELRVSEERFRQLATNIEELFWLTDARTGEEIYTSPAIESIWGMSVEYFQNTPDAFINSILPEDREMITRTLEKQRSGEKTEMEYRIIRPDGSTRWIWDRGFPIFDNSGSVTSVAGIAADVTQRKQAEDALRASEARFSNAFEFAPIGIGLVSLDGQWLKANNSLCNLLGYSEQELKAKTFQEITHPEDLEIDLSFVRQTVAGEITSYQIEKRYLHKSGKIVWVLMSVSLVKDLEERPQYFISQIQDITERKRVEEENRRRAEETDALLRTSLSLTHLDLKTILPSIGHSARELFNADGCRIFLMQADNTTLRCVLALQENAGSLSDLRIKIGEGVTGTVAANGRAEIVNEMQNDPRALHIPGTDDAEEESIMFAPLKERDRTLGVISIRRAGTQHPFAPADLEVLEALASMAASAVSNARFFEEAQRRLSELEALYENGLAVGKLLEPSEIGARIIATFTHYLSWHHVAIRLLDPDTNEMRVIALNQPGLSEEERIEMERHFNRKVSKRGQGLSGWVVQTGTPLRTGNVHAHEQYVDTQAGIWSGLYMPLKVSDQVLGVISVESERPDAFTEQDERLLATLANQAAIAFENARLYQAAQQEIFERRRAQKALWLSETHYRELADSITDILFELDHDLHYTHWNKASEMFSGIPAEETIGRSIREVFGDSEPQFQREDVYKSVLEERQARIFETEIFAKGQRRFLEINAYPSAKGVSVVAKDVTERKLDEILLLKRFELIEYAANHSFTELTQRTIDEISILTESHVGFLHLIEDDEKTVTWQAWSSETIGSVGNTASIGMHFPIDSAGVWADAVRQRRTTVHNDYESLPDKKGLPDGHIPLTRELIIPIVRSDKIVAVLGLGNKNTKYTEHDIDSAERFADYAWDVIERRHMEDALADERNQLAIRVEERTADLSRANSNLARALRVKDEFLANMSHELRTPLNAILGLSESLGEQVAGPLNEKQQKYLSTINESGHHLLALINDILDLAKIEAGQITLDINKVDVNSVCQASLRMIKQLAQRKNQEVHFEIDSEIGLMWADERRLKQMIVNLLSNAVKFTSEFGKLGLEVRGDKAGNKVILSVWDQGIGISETDIQRLFKPFVQLDSGLARGATGTGLGLALVAQMARLHGGSVTLESQVGSGSRFTIRLPWEPALAGDTNSRLKTTGKFRAVRPGEIRPTILLIEDTHEVVMMLVDYLEMAGFNMVTAQDGVDGLTQAKLYHPNLILMDIQMPRMDGFETTKRLRSDPEFRETPIIALTALAMPNDRQRCMEAGMNEYLSKPVNLKALVKTIKAFIYNTETTQS